MDKPTKIAIKFIAAGLIAHLVIALIGRFVLRYEGSITEYAVGVFSGMLYCATRAAYMQGKRDAQEDRQDK